jgi:DNA-binding XRE family transcriptional regulator
MDKYTEETVDLLQRAYGLRFIKPPGNDPARRLLMEMRHKLKMTQTKFAAYIGVPMRTLQNWEYGVHRIPEYVVKNVAMLKMILFGDNDIFPDQ